MYGIITVLEGSGGLAELPTSRLGMNAQASAERPLISRRPQCGEAFAASIRTEAVFPGAQMRAALRQADKGLQETSPPLIHCD